MNQASLVYSPRKLTLAEDAMFVRLADVARKATGKEREYALEHLDGAMTQAWITRHDKAGVAWHCKVTIDDVDVVVPWAEKNGFRAPHDRRRLVKNLVHFVECRLRDGEQVLSEGITLTGQVVLHAVPPTPLASVKRLR
jgi:hypothetical protein